jgi:uncharacterized protein YlaI
MIKCGFCGHTDNIERWTQTPIYGNLPAGTYQCPHCGRAFERVPGKPRVFSSGFTVPGKVSLVPVATRL